MSDYSATNYNSNNKFQNYGFSNPVPRGATITVGNYNSELCTVSQTDTVSLHNNSIQPENKKQGISTGAKFAIGAGIVTALAVCVDFLFCKGKHIKSIFGKPSNKGGLSSSSKPILNSTNTNHSATSTPTLQQTKPTSKGSSNHTVPVNSVNAGSNVSNDEMRAYIAKKYNTGIDYKSTPCRNYAEAIDQNYLGIRTCPKDYYNMNKSYDANRLFDISSKGRKGICVDDNNGMGWFYRQATKNLQTGQAQPKAIERISLNVYPDENLIKALDDFIIRTNENVYYKVPQAFDDWITRHDPITMYFAEKPSQSTKEDLIKIVTPYIRTPKGEVMIGTKLANSIYQIPNPSEQDVLNLIKRAEKLGDNKLVECLKTPDNPKVGARLYSYSKSQGKPVAKTSAGLFRAAEMLIEDLERFQPCNIV